MILDGLGLIMIDPLNQTIQKTRPNKTPRAVEALRAFVVSLLNSTFRPRRFTTFVVETTSATAKTEPSGRPRHEALPSIAGIKNARPGPWPQNTLLFAVLQGGRSYFIF